MGHSESIAELTAALAKAQANFQPAFKDTTNPAFGDRGRYADLASIIGASRPALNAQGIVLVQSTSVDIERHAASVTTSLHLGDQWISNTAEAPAIGRGDKFDVQSIGACWTYLRRYTLQALLGIAAEEDDDGNSISDTGQQAGRTTKAPRPTTTAQSAQQATQRAATAPAAAQPHVAVLKFVPPNGLTAAIKGVKEIEPLPAKPANGDIPAMKAVRGRLAVTLLGMNSVGAIDRVTRLWLENLEKYGPTETIEMSCFDTKLWPALKESVGLECHFQIAEKDSNGKHYLNIEDLIYVAGEEYVNGKPVPPNTNQQ